MTDLLEIRGVWQRFGGLIANSDISISVGRGEIVGLIGPNGAGKSTLFNLIAGVLPPTQGSILFDGEDVTMLPAVVGGIGTLWGPLLGAVILIPLKELTSSYIGGSGRGVDLIVYGALIVLISLARPEGLVSLFAPRLFASSRKAPAR